MRLLVLSDLHTEFEDFVVPSVDWDVAVLAGDIGVGERGLEWIEQNIGDRPCVYVLGNHEYYRNAIPRLVSKLTSRNSGTNIHLLDRSEVVVGGVRFAGCTLWTDFELGNQRLAAMITAGESMTDYKKIRRSPEYRRLWPSDTAGCNAADVLWLRGVFQSDEPEPLVVVTHHAPSPRSLFPGTEGDLLNAAYASDLESLVAESNAEYWLHGHIHRSVSYTIGETKVVCNPRGYPDEPAEGFDPGLVIEIDE